MCQGAKMRWYIFIIATAICFVSAGCQGKQTEQSPDYSASSTVKDIMDSIVDPNADLVWGALSETITAKGIQTNMPRTDKEWKEVRRHAITLVEATNLLMVPNRHVAKPGEKADSHDMAATLELRSIRGTKPIAVLPWPQAASL